MAVEDGTNLNPERADRFSWGEAGEIEIEDEKPQPKRDAIKSPSVKDIPKLFKGRRLNGGSMCGTCNGKKYIKVLHPTGGGKRLNDAPVEYTRTWEPCPDCNGRIQGTQ